MITLRWMLLVVILPATALPAYAQGIFGLGKKTAKAEPAQRVPELIATLKSDRDDRARTSAAEELRDHDPQVYSEIIPVLVEAALRDPRTAVRMEALSSLSKLRPVNAEAGQTLERAASNDENLRVRLHARTTLWKYQLAGYSRNTGPAAAKDKNGPRTDEPPLADPKIQIVPGPTLPNQQGITPVGPALPGAPSSDPHAIPLPDVPRAVPPASSAPKAGPRINAPRPTAPLTGPALTGPALPGPALNPSGVPVPPATARPVTAPPVSAPTTTAPPLSTPPASSNPPPARPKPGFSTAVPQAPRTVPSTEPVIIEDTSPPPSAPQSAPPPPLPKQ